MPRKEDIRWLKAEFGAEIEAAISDTPFELDQLVAVACQETGYIWSILRKTNLDRDEILALCVGDTIDFKPPDKGRKAFPRNKAALLLAENGKAMFDIARAGLVAMAKYVPGYDGAVANPDKFCRGYGMFQRDLQFYITDPDYFLEQKYAIFDDTLRHCLQELIRAIKKLDLDDEEKLSDADFTKVAIAYNTGGYKPSKGLKQGYFDGSKYYGEWIAHYLALSRSVQVEPIPSLSSGWFTVSARDGLRLRSGPGTAYDWERVLPLGTRLRVVRTDPNSPEWATVDLEGDGLVDGCVYAAFLKPVSDEDQESVAEPD